MIPGGETRGGVRGMADLIALSREYGGDPRWVAAGGGNTSLKDGGILYVKASGFPLAGIDEGGFARMDRGKLAEIWRKDYPKGQGPDVTAERERLVLADQMAARMEGEERRPSVEALVHDLLPWPLVVHLHPTLVNGLTCGVEGREIARELFGENHVWIPVTDPGYTLASVIRESLGGGGAAGAAGAFEAASGPGVSGAVKAPDYILLANHGVFVGGEDAREIRAKYDRLDRVLREYAGREPEAVHRSAEIPARWDAWAAAVRNCHGEDAAAAWLHGGELDRRLKSRAAAEPLIGCLTPDHIVYAGPGALYAGDPERAEAEGAGAGGNRAPGAGGVTEGLGRSAASGPAEGLQDYQNRWGKAPNVILLPGGALAAASGEKALNNAVLLLKNALEVCAYTESFGGPRFLEERFVRFIVGWEVEAYRSKVSSA